MDKKLKIKLKDIWSGFSRNLKRLINTLLFKRGLVQGLYLYLFMFYEFMFIIFSNISRNNSLFNEKTYIIYRQNMWLLLTIFLLLCFTSIFVDFNCIDKGSMVWNALLLISFVFILFFPSGGESNIILKTALSLGTIESLVKNIFKSIDLSNKSKLTNLKDMKIELLIEKSNFELEKILANNQITYLKNQAVNLENQINIQKKQDIIYQEIVKHREIDK